MNFKSHAMNTRNLFFGMALFASVLLSHAASAYYPLDSNDSFDAPALVWPSVGDAVVPLSAADRISVQRGHFFAAGPDGKTGTTDDVRVRLFGTNLSNSANFPPQEVARKLARRLRMLGFNAVRLHQMDIAPDAAAQDPQSQTVQSILTTGPFPAFNAKSVERLKALLAAFRDEGIYVNLNLHVGYRFRPGIDGVPPMPGNASASLPMSSPVHIFHPALIDLQVRYAQTLIKALGVGYDPMLAMVELRNESSLASAWLSWNSHEWTDAMQGVYGDELTRQWNAWLVQTYGSVEKACARWQGCASNGPQALLSPEEGDALRTGQHDGTLSRLTDKGLRIALPLLDKARALVGWSAWTRPLSGAQLRGVDFMRFIAETDQRYFHILKAAVRAVSSPTLPITGTQMGYGGALNHLSQSSMDYVDDHFYIDHYDFAGGGWDDYDWRIKDTSLTGAEMASVLELAQHRDVNRPFVLSEFNQPFPNRQGAEILPAFALIGAVQDWDGLFQFDFSSADNRSENWMTTPGSFTLAGDVAKLALVRQAADLFRWGAVMPALTSSVTAFDPAQVLLSAAQRKRMGRGASLPGSGSGGGVVDAAWTAQGVFQTRLGVAVGMNLGATYDHGVSANTVFPSKSAVSGPLKPVAVAADAATKVLYSAEDGQLMFNTPQGVGFLGRHAPGQRVTQGAFTFEPLDTSRGFATVVVSPLDKGTVNTASRLLVSLPGYVMGSQPGAAFPRPTKLVPYVNSSANTGIAGTNSDWWTMEPIPASRTKPSGLRQAQGKLWMARVPLKLSLRTRATALQVFPLSLAGLRLAPLPASFVLKRDDGFEITLQGEPNPQSPWYELVQVGGTAVP